MAAGWGVEKDEGRSDDKNTNQVSSFFLRLYISEAVLDLEVRQYESDGARNSIGLRPRLFRILPEEVA
jgi:hypothetical protein